MKFITRLKDESGQAIVLFALVVTLMLGCCALVVDVGYMHYMRSDLQTAADSAALSAAGQFPRFTNTQIRNLAVSYANKNLNSTINKTITVNLDRDHGRVEVIIKQLAPKFFAGFVSSGNEYITRSAVAKYNSQWAGESLPFLNLDAGYYPFGTWMYVWDKVFSGDFESIDNYEMVNEDDPTSIYFEIDYMNGVVLKKGVVATIKQEIGWIYNQNRDHVYILSLSQAVVNRGTVKMTDGSYRDITKLKNGDVVHPSQLVLVECDFIFYSESAKMLILVSQAVYDFYNGVLPPDYQCPGKVAAKLIR